MIDRVTRLIPLLFLISLVSGCAHPGLEAEPQPPPAQVETTPPPAPEVRQETVKITANRLNLRSGKSFVDALESSEPMESAIELAPDYGFWALPATTEQGEETQIAFEGTLERLGQALPEMKKKYPCILLDTPPVIPFIDSTIISGMSDGVVLVVESNLTRAQMVDHAIEKLKAAGAKLSGIVLNKREFHIPKWIHRFF